MVLEFVLSFSRTRYLVDRILSEILMVMWILILLPTWYYKSEQSTTAACHCCARKCKDCLIIDMIAKIGLHFRTWRTAVIRTWYCCCCVNFGGTRPTPSNKSRVCPPPQAGARIRAHRHEATVAAGVVVRCCCCCCCCCGLDTRTHTNLCLWVEGIYTWRDTAAGCAGPDFLPSDSDRAQASRNATRRIRQRGFTATQARC